MKFNPRTWWTRFATLMAMTTFVAGCGLVVSFDDYGTEGRPDAVTRLFGLSGTVVGVDPRFGLTLFLNQAALFDVRNGPFVFPPSVPDEGSWLLRWKAFGQRCTIDPDTGVIAAQDVKGVVVSCVSTDAGASR